MSDDEEIVYPVIDTLPDGCRRVGMDSKGRPAPDLEHSSGWVIHPEDIPNHKHCRDCKRPPHPGRARCVVCAEKNRKRTAARYERLKLEGKRWL